jgi:hypothetical protein
MMNLDEFLDKSLKTYNVSRATSRAHVKREGFLFLFLRIHGSSDVEGPVLDIATVTVLLADRGKGLFSKMLRHIKYKYPDVSIRVESVKEPRFQQYLAKLGFAQSSLNNFFLDAQKDLPPSR